MDLFTAAANENGKAQKDTVFKNNVLFRSCISKDNNALRSKAENLDIVMSMYNLSEYSDNYSMIPGIYWNYYRDEIEDFDERQIWKNQISMK